MTNSIRFQQRFANFEKAYKQLQGAIAQDDYSVIEKAGLVQIFEFTLELAWNLLKDKLDYEGYSAKTPREVIKQAYQIGYIIAGEKWLDALEKRNLLAHTYDDVYADAAVKLIKTEYYQLMASLYDTTKKMI